MDVAAIRQAMVSARAVLITAHNEAERFPETARRKQVFSRRINDLNAAIRELDSHADPRVEKAS